MTMLTDERIVNQCSLDLDFGSEVSEDFSLSNTLKKVKELIEKEEISKLFNHESVKIKLSEISIHENYACLLLSKVDKDVANIVYSDIVTFERREIHKKENEGNTLCCHVVISLNPTDKNTYNCVIEQVLGIGLISDVSRFLQYIFKEYGLIFVGDKAIAPKCKLKGRECKSITDVLQNNILSKIKLSSKREYSQGVDYPDYVSVEEKKITIHGKVSGRSALNIFRDLITLNLPRYTSVSLTVSDGKKQKTNHIPLQTTNNKGDCVRREIDDILGDAFFQPERVTGLKGLETAHKNIREDLVSKMLPFLGG